MKTKSAIVLFIILLILSINYCSSTETVNATGDIYEMTDYKIGVRDELCQGIADSWAGTLIRYKGYDDFLDKCNMISYSTEMNLAQQVRPLIKDGHFDIGLADFHNDNKFEEAKRIPLVVTYDIMDEAAIVKSTEELRKKGLKEGNIILKINGIEIIYYTDILMKQMPYSTYYQTKEVAYRVLFNTVKYPTPNYYFELPTFDGSEPLDITYLDTTTGEIDTVSVEFELMSANLENENQLEITWANYWSIHKLYNVNDDNVCFSNNEFATLKKIDGKNWLIYHVNSFQFDIREEKIKESFKCYLQFFDKIDYFVLDIRDSVGGAWDPTNALLGIIGCTGEFDLPVKSYNSGELNDWMVFEMKALKIEELPRIGEKAPVYIWVNSLAGSACDMLLYAVKNSDDEHIKILGKPSAGRFIAVSNNSILDFDVKAPLAPIYDIYGYNLEGKAILPDYYFDVNAEDYKSADNVFHKFVEFIKANNL